jgi:hypothetical protein
MTTRSEAPATADSQRAALRAAHQVRPVDAREEGTGIDALPAGVYGFTYSPALAAPLFGTRRYRNFEMHKTRDGELLIVGFAPAAEAERLTHAAEIVEIAIVADAEPGAETAVAIPYSRIVHHRQYSVRNEHGLRLHVSPAGVHASA